MEPNTSKMEDIINETQTLIDTLENLNNEIESYQVAKNNLIDVKNKLEQFTYKFAETSNVIKDNIIEMNQSLRSDLAVRLDHIKIISEESKIYFDNKIKLLTGLVVINTIGIIAAIIISSIK